MSQIISNLRIQKILAHFEFLQAKLNENLNNDDLIKFSKEYAELKPIYEHIQKFNKINGSKPFKISKQRTKKAKNLFPVRSTFVAPTLPEPMFLISPCPKIFGINRAKGIDPIK